MRLGMVLLALVFALMAVVACGAPLPASEAPAEEMVPAPAEPQREEPSETLSETPPAEEEELPPVVTLEDLEQTDIFGKNSLVHIFEGEINRKGNATGYHSEALPDTPGEVIPGTETEPNAQGVYTAQVRVDGVEKTSNRGYSSFFPQDWTAQQVVDAINQAYATRQHDGGNTYIGQSDQGMLISMYLDQQDKIISAFPLA